MVDVVTDPSLDHEILLQALAEVTAQLRDGQRRQRDLADHCIDVGVTPAAVETASGIPWRLLYDRARSRGRR